MPKYLIGDHEVVIREKYAARAHYGLLDKLRRMLDDKSTASFDERIGILSQFIESWDYDGPVSDTTTWERMDAIRDLAGIQTAIVLYVGGLGVLAKKLGDAARDALEAGQIGQWWQTRPADYYKVWRALLARWTGWTYDVIDVMDRDEFDEACYLQAALNHWLKRECIYGR